MTTITRWHGQRRADEADSDYDMAMSTVMLETPDGQGFETRDEARNALMKMVMNEILEVAEDSSYCVIRLTKILQQLIANPTWNQAVADGLRFAIWPVTKSAPAVVTNVSDLSEGMKDALLIGSIDSPIRGIKRSTGDALIHRGFLEYIGASTWKRTEAGKRARAALEAQTRG